jgi:Ca-activated chloride channel family protein
MTDSGYWRRLRLTLTHALTARLLPLLRAAALGLIAAAPLATSANAQQQPGATTIQTPNGPIPVQRGSAAAPASQNQTQNQTQTLSVHVRLVSVFVNVTDSAGAPVPNLTRDNFQIAEDNQPQPIAVFEKQSGVPLSLVLAIDTSGSTHKDSSVEQHAARDFVHALIRPVDQLSVYEFNSDVREVVPFTSNVHRIDEGLGSLGRGPATAFYEAVYLAAQGLGSHSGRKVLVLISDGGNTVSGTTYQQALEQAQRGEVMIYSIIDVPIEADAGRDTGGEHAMITLSQETGGKYFYADSQHLDEAFRKISDDLRTQYLLAYYPRQVAQGDLTLAAQRDAYHSISVSLSGLGPDLHYTPLYRTGYYRAVAP